MMPNPLKEEESCLVYNCDNERLPGPTKDFQMYVWFAFPLLL